MTALDKVFIKAYGKSAAQSQTTLQTATSGHRIDPAHAAPAAPLASALLAPREEAPSATLQNSVTPPEQARIDARHELPRPHWPALAGMQQSVLNNLSAPVAEVMVESHTISTAPNAPSTSKPVDADPTTGEQPTASATRAAFEVDRFLWPETCQKLMAAAHWSEASRELAAASREGQQVFVIASQHRGEGRTTLALCLAQRLSEKNLRVTLVDADFHRPQLARSLKLLPAATWDDVLRGSLPLTESWIESVEDRVTLLPLKERADTTGLIGNSRLKELFSLLRRTSDIVLIDAGSLEDFGDREVLALLGGTAQMDGALLVRDVRKTSSGELEQTPSCLDALGIARVDVVENFVTS